MVAAANSRIITILPSAPSPDPGMPLMPISPPSQPCLRTMPMNRKFTPIVVTARKSVRSRIGAGPIESAMAETNLATEAADHVETDGEDHIDADHREQADFVGAHAARVPTKPCGLTINSAMRARNAIASRSSHLPMKIVP